MYTTHYSNPGSLIAIDLASSAPRKRPWTLQPTRW